MFVNSNQKGEYGCQNREYGKQIRAEARQEVSDTSRLRDYF